MIDTENGTKMKIEYFIAYSAWKLIFFVEMKYSYLEYKEYEEKLKIFRIYSTKFNIFCVSIITSEIVNQPKKYEKVKSKIANCRICFRGSKLMFGINFYVSNLDF